MELELQSIISVLYGCRWLSRGTSCKQIASLRLVFGFGAHFAKHRLDHGLMEEQSLRHVAWRAFRANPGSKAARPLSISERLALPDRAVASQLAYRLSRWPPQKMVARKVDSTQSKIVASILRRIPWTLLGADAGLLRSSTSRPVVAEMF